LNELFFFEFFVIFWGIVKTAVQTESEFHFHQASAIDTMLSLQLAVART
jgi:hypothetical protein